MGKTPVVALAYVTAILAAASTALAGGYNTPTAGQSPHGNYADSTTKCKVCHAVHNAASSDTKLGGGTETLLRSKRGFPDISVLENPDSGNACVYCHIVGDWAITKVYGGVLANYTSDSRRNHDDAHRAATGWGPANYAGCMSCHSVHGANLLAGYETEIVSNDPGPWLAAPATSLSAFCRDCHEDYTYPGGPYSGRWGWRCGFCHNTMFFTRGGTEGTDNVDQMPPFFTQARNGVTHVMTTTLTGNYGTQVAWADSDECRDCHAGGAYTQGNNFPHYTSGAYFLDDNYQPPDVAPGGPDSGMDRVCLNCHVQGGNGASYTTGVGKTF